MNSALQIVVAVLAVLLVVVGMLVGSRRHTRSTLLGMAINLAAVLGLIALLITGQLSDSAFGGTLLAALMVMAAIRLVVRRRWNNGDQVETG